jgi:putative hemolysin
MMGFLNPLLFVPTSILAYKEMIGEGLLIILFLILSVLISALRASYSVAGVMDNTWIRKAHQDEAHLPSHIQQLSLSVIQRIFTLSGLLLGAHFVWANLYRTGDDIFIWIGLTGLSIWIWIDIFVRYQFAKMALNIVPKLIPITQFFFKAINPFTNLISKVGTLLGILSPEGEGLSIERLEAQSESEEQTDLLRGLVNFKNTTARKAMQARLHITAFDIELDFHELMDKINKSGYSRVPVFREDIDHIEGILNVKDLLPHLHNDEFFKWQRLLRPAYFIPESKQLDDLMKEFQERRVHMAVVVDEYGGTSGLITLEDIIEEIFGDINDEYDDEEEVNYVQVDDNTYVFEGKVSITDLCRLLHLENDYFDEVRGNSESLGGLLLELFSRMPPTGESYTFKNIIFKVQSSDKKRIKKVRVILL